MSEVLNLIENFSITDAAKEQIKASCHTEATSQTFLRIMIEIGGCAGMKYHIIIDDYLADNDLVMKFDEKIYLAIDDYSMEYLKGGTLDFEETLEFSGFKLDNPNASSSCSCGSSFGCG